MRAIQVTQYVDSPSSLRVTTLTTPPPHPSKYLIRVHTAGINFFDLLQIQGKYQHQPPLPWISGAEFAGTVLSTPTSPPPTPPNISSSSSSSSTPKTHRFRPGDRVFGATQGAYATHILCPETSLQPIPCGWSFHSAAGLYVTAPTAYSALVTRAHTQPGEWVLIHAGAGGVGLSAVQVAKALGATVIATAGTERKRQICRDYGADYVVDYSSKDSKAGDWPAEVVRICARERTGNGRQGVDVVYDPVGMIEPSLKCVAWNARLLVIGFAAARIEKVALNRVLLKNVSVMGLHWGMYATMEVEMVEEVWASIFRLIEEGKFKGIAYRDGRFDGLEAVPAALKALAERETWGKVVVDVSQDEEGGRGELDREGPRKSKL